MSSPPVFDDDFRDKLGELIAWRRDIRRFRREPVSEELLAKLLDLMQLAPSVGHSQPWRWLRVDDPEQRAAVQASFSRCNADALAEYEGERAALYARLKLEGLREAPVQFAVFCDHGTAQGHGLGRRTMPEMLDYSVVAAITQFWLAARAHGLGLGWVSILAPAEITAITGAPPEWKLIGYLCLGYPEEENDVPELVRAGWERDQRLTERD
ncbi:5,6-dimethylbenzimidazole synthase [Bosea sp. 62]|uniref:5,6-dimethylbenzimidazole synthase n=1 Tax=unclassified Bosea (in: a-proteobacteria) TaxID=2653178 RepID=UPI001257F9E6|nr:MULTISPECIES: 5,6-dimethylbenzimidazole synthase [unclassified Bosea (in: a-proteobacteria)]CAD5288406.1 5,6-dimethylbenzimidazole synthase [Bosea sp. 21B]CAD5290710.1 5,6-dimethylbenzimidazole synthase [Bosea sp. 46]CAD5300854.1 5,6-dimethylbenzimidazole synthase [Bosea sp. 7B]VVT60355.1 5,6-dimethylbenzimidazole synthase [Bosea sp. EC-HK365B]VXA97047.1 5,6-dimethylbenzimidazole synthase [Bosea sp. 62]